MKGIIFKLVVVFLITVIISISVGCTIEKYALDPDFTYTVNGVNQEDFNPKMLGFNAGIIMFFILTLMLAGFYIVNISILVTTYKGTKEIENKDIIYQRDLADDYNSAIASFIIDGTVETRQDYKAVLVELEERGEIYIENGKYKVKNDSNNIKEKLLLNQQIVLNQINEGKMNLNEFKNAVIEDAKKLGYVKTNKNLIPILIFLTFMFPMTIFLIIYILIAARPYLNVLTEKGKKEKDKIIKLKSYLSNFSNLHDIESSDNNIWGDYLAYAISLKVNKSLKVKRINLI